MLAQETIVDHMEEAAISGDYDSFLIWNHKAHDYYVKKSNNIMLQTLHKKMTSFPVPIYYFNDEEQAELMQTMANSVQEHRSLLKCFRTKDIENVKKILIQQFRLENTALSHLS